MCVYWKGKMQECYFPLDRVIIPLCYNTTRTITTDEKIVQVLEALQEGQKELQAEVASIKDVLQNQGKQLEQQGTQLLALQADVKTLNGKVDTVELKVETIHEYQKKA